MNPAEKAHRLACDAFFLALAVKVHGWVAWTRDVGLDEFTRRVQLNRVAHPGRLYS